MLQSSAYRTKRWPRRSNSRSSSFEHEIAEQWRKWTTLRSPFHAGADQPVLHHPSIQECPDELQQPLVLDPFGDLAHQFVVVDSIEKFLQIKINAPAVTFGDILLRLDHCLMSRPSRPKTVAVIGKRPVPPPLQNLRHRLLDKSIQHRRDGHCELHWTTARIWDGLRSVTRSIRCEASASKYSRSDAYRASILLSSASWNAAVSASRANGRTGPIRLRTTCSACCRSGSRLTRFSNWSPY